MTNFDVWRPQSRWRELQFLLEWSGLAVWAADDGMIILIEISLTLTGYNKQHLADLVLMFLPVPLAVESGWSIFVC